VKVNRDIIEKRTKWFAAREVPHTSKPGIPYSSLGNNNADILPNNIDLIAEAVYERLQLLSEATPEELSEATPQELVQKGYCDPVRVFIKREPHSLRKVSSKRWRLIFAISIVDQLVERILCSEQNKTEIQQWNNCPSAPGLSLSNDDDLKALYERIMIKCQGKSFAEADVTGWDWSVKEWELKLEAEMRIELGNFSPLAASIIRARFICVSRSVYAFPDGELYVLKGNGVQLSGCYNTSSTNSRIRVLVALLAGAEWAVAMGDDSVEGYSPGAEAIYARLGHPLKMYVERTNNFEFCSMQFQDGPIHPVDGTKTLFRLIEQKNITPELVRQFDMEMRNHPRKEEFRDSYTRVIEAREGQNIVNILHECTQVSTNTKTPSSS
jgi:hypothetical protein